MSFEINYIDYRKVKQQLIADAKLSLVKMIEEGKPLTIIKISIINA